MDDAIIELQYRDRASDVLRYDSPEHKFSVIAEWVPLPTDESYTRIELPPHLASVGMKIADRISEGLSQMGRKKHAILQTVDEQPVVGGELDAALAELRKAIVPYGWDVAHEPEYNVLHLSHHGSIAILPGFMNLSELTVVEVQKIAKDLKIYDYLNGYTAAHVLLCNRTTLPDSEIIEG